MLRSATALSVQSEGIPLTTKSPLVILAPSINHTATSPLLEFCHRTSVLPSPLKSPMALNSQSLGTPRTG
ncbi:hypothetical protein MBAV_003797 [Candidatus Magnetobacterium bavaricum]|uniref:Uncharacterized protein n=1 Tax=Candidatus Magnetobacterium bavaricum TaxID=29290 RepID=A0A0F3GPZ9_9BACT|nr:hypothetical protein MBAV_003797 [Candidatus Magnetobacterium bavaricum]